MNKTVASKDYEQKTEGVDAAAWSDERLVKECLEGNENAWFGLIDKYKNLIYSIPIKHRVPPDAANEIFQQVCVELVTALLRLREANALRAWLIRVTSNKCFDWSRREQRYEPMVNHNEDTLPVIEKAPEVLLLELEREQILREVISQLSPQCQTLIRMLFFDSPTVPYEEVAMSLGLAKGSIGFTRMRCLRRLRRLLEERGFP